MRKTIIILTCSVVLLLLGYTSYRGYQVWKQNHGIAMAKSYLANGDLRSASLAVQQVLRVNPRNLEACRMMANFLGAEPAVAVRWWQRVLELNPGSFDDRMALAKAAISSRDIALAASTLAGASDAGKQTEIYHDLAGTAALMSGRFAEAEAHFSEAIRLAPSDPIPQMDLAVLRLHGTNALDMAEARISLQRIIEGSTNAALRIQARRELVNDALHFKDYPAAFSLSKELVQQTNAVFKDKILRLDALKAGKSEELRTALAMDESEAANDIAKITDLAGWQMLNLSPSEALAWLRRLPSQTQTNIQVEVLVALCLSQSGDWRGLQASIANEDWQDPEHWWDNCEFMRHAYLAQSLRGQGLPAASAAEWGFAVKSASEQKVLILQEANFKQLFEMAYQWKWATEAEQVLWTIINQYPNEKWAYPILRNMLLFEHRTRSLLQLMETMHKRMPNDLSIDNNLAATALLLGDQESKPYELAQQVYQQDPTNPQCASTYAFALYSQGKPANALKVMQQLDSKYLQAPSIALYYAMILKANGDKTQARAYLDRVSRAQLWPEEQALYDKANAGL